MARNSFVMVCCLFAGLVMDAEAQQAAVPRTPSPPPLVGSIAGHTDWPAAKDAKDVDTPEHLVAALYEVISGPAGERDWGRFRSLFLPDGRIAVVRPATPATKDAPENKGDVMFLSPDMYAERDTPYFRAHGFFERSIANRMEEFGNLVEVWSTYESRNAKDDAQPFSRGINSIQIAHARGRFWIASVLFDDERPGETLPDKYLK